MKLPNRKKAQVPKEKLLNYLLSESHPVGRSKAKFFKKLGFNETNAEEFEKALLLIASQNEIDDTKESGYGINYTIKGSLSSSEGKAAYIQTVWFIGTRETIPRFITAFPDIIPKRKKAQK